MAFLSILQLFALFGIGWLGRRLGMLGEAEEHGVSRFCVHILFPCFAFSTIIEGFDPDRLAEVWMLPLLGFGLMAAGGVAGIFLRRGLKSRDPEVARAFHHICAINNFGFLPIFIIENTMGKAALSLFFCFNLGSTFGYWTIGILTLGGGAGMRETLRRLVTPGIISVLLALGCAFAGAKGWMPAGVMRVISYAGAPSIPLMIMLTGCAMFQPLHRAFLRDLIYTSGVRLALLPACSPGCGWCRW
ncbi:MAG: AEC family transporter [Verrucomicrobiales bacterium]